MWAIQLDLDSSSKYQLETQLDDQSKDIDLNNCRVLDEVLWKDDKLWVSQSMIIWLIRKAHDLLINDHSDMN